VLPNQRDWICAGMRPKEEQQTGSFLTSLEYFPITFPTAQLAGEYKRDFSKKGEREP